MTQHDSNSRPSKDKVAFPTTTLSVDDVLIIDHDVEHAQGKSQFCKKKCLLPRPNMNLTYYNKLFYSLS